MLESYNNLWLFYSANEWGTDTTGSASRSAPRSMGPCTKPLDHAWLSSSAQRCRTTRPRPGGEEFFQVGGLVWMVHHGLAPGQSGDDAQRRLYVDLLAFTNGISRLGLPREIRPPPSPKGCSTTRTRIFRHSPERPTSCFSTRAGRSPAPRMRAPWPTDW